MTDEPSQKCELCRRATHLTRHHLIPRSVHQRKRVRRLFSRMAMHGNVIQVCRVCHNKIHATFSEMELALHYNTLERLLSHEEIRKFVAWIEKRPDGFRPKGRIRRR